MFDGGLARALEEREGLLGFKRAGCHPTHVILQSSHIFPRGFVGAPPILLVPFERLRSAARPFTCNKKRATPCSEALTRGFERKLHQPL